MPKNVVTSQNLKVSHQYYEQLLMYTRPLKFLKPMINQMIFFKQIVRRASEKAFLHKKPNLRMLLGRVHSSRSSH